MSCISDSHKTRSSIPTQQSLEPKPAKPLVCLAEQPPGSISQRTHKKQQKSFLRTPAYNNDQIEQFSAFYKLLIVSMAFP